MAAAAYSRKRARVALGRRKRRQLAPRRWLGCLLRDRRGVSAVELGLTAAFILPPLGSVFDLGMAFSQQIKVQQAVQAGAQYASMRVWEGSSSPAAVRTAVMNSLPASLQSAVSVAGGFNADGTASPPDPYQACYCPTGTSGTYFTSTDSLSTCGTTTCSNGEKSGYYVTVAAKVNYTPIAPYSWVFMGDPQTRILTQIVNAVVRIQ